MRRHVANRVKRWRLKMGSTSSVKRARSCWPSPLPGYNTQTPFFYIFFLTDSKNGHFRRFNFWKNSKTENTKVSSILETRRRRGFRVLIQWPCFANCSTANLQMVCSRFATEFSVCFSQFSVWLLHPWILLSLSSDLSVWKKSRLSMFTATLFFGWY